jgi:cellulose biosynthesis protein BcsQ
MEMIYTFYSYKGGVGRSMALANIAELFFQAGLKVLMVDWDLEAPGLERFFYSEVPKKIINNRGVIDLISEYKNLLSKGIKITEDQLYSGNLPFEKPDKHLINIYPELSNKGSLWLLSAGNRSPDNISKYTNTVLGLDWKDLYQNWAGEVYFEWLRAQLIRIADVVLIDSRTGLSEMGGVCTYQLADAVIMLCSASEQCIEGTHQLLLNLKRDEIRESRGRNLDVLVIPARVENAESDYLNEFQARFLHTFSKYMPDNIDKGTSLFDQLAIPYTPRYAYRETIAVKEKSKASARKMVDTFNRLAFALSRLAPIDSEIKSAFPETEITIGGETVIGSVVSGSLVVGSQVLDTQHSIIGDFIGGNKIITNITGTQQGDEQTYLNGLISRYETMKEIYVPLAGIVEHTLNYREKSKIKISQSLVPIEFNLINNLVKKAEPSKPVFVQYEDIREAFKKYHQIIILGEPGSGKTATLWNLALEYASIAIESDDAPIPVYLPLSSIKEKESFEDCLDRHLGPLCPYLETILSSKGIVLLLDGLNEISKPQYTLQLQRIKEWQMKYPNQRIAITCRTREVFEDVSSFSKVRIFPLDEKRIQSYINKYLQESYASQLIGTLESDSALLEFSRNPYMLFMMIQVYVTYGEIPNNRPQLYDIFVDTLLSREGNRVYRNSINNEQQKAGLALLAYASQIHGGVGTSFEKDWALNQIHQNIPDLNAESLLNIASNANLINISDTVIRFTHQSFQEYFAGLELARRASESGLSKK